MTRYDSNDLSPPSLNEEDMIDFANDALEVEDRIAVARVLSKMPNEAAQTFGHMADKEELLLALGLLKRMDDYPTIPAPLPPASTRKRGVSRQMGLGLSCVAALLVGLIATTGTPIGNSIPSRIVEDALQANVLAQLRLEMETMDEDTMVDLAEIRHLAGLVVPEHPKEWTLRDTQVLPADDGVSVVQSFHTGNDGLVTLYVAHGGNPAPQSPSRLSVEQGQGAWFRHGGLEYVLIGREANAPLDDEATLLMASFSAT
ncbi:hypothetical protein IV417_11010 [Alphaproteobacteria bacterium KMM 3653]|uniref:Anti-sigma factor n=1 Tax=Harenicola maris TaxID=2841044 RepID=A0AAP2CSU1_9RHOB|nr:hypothetical protein [Harenicola maris]